ncbi:MAG: hypothetical protein ICV59_07485 [Thermoleophilia bacterium]|nr:hypothetical protein [Thermoleophilia bacterium]
MASARLRFAVEGAALVALGIALAVAGVDVAPFAIVMAVAWVLVAVLERTMLQPRAHGVDGDLETPRETDEEAAAPLVVAEREEEAVEPAAVERAGARGDRIVVPVDEQPGVAGPVEPEPRPETMPQPRPAPPVEVPREPEPEPVASPAPPAVVELPLRRGAGWNLWELERRARERAGGDVQRDEEWAALLVYLREYASPDGMLPAEFDELVRESFAELTGRA